MSVRTLLRMTAPLRDAVDVAAHDVGAAGAPVRLALVAGIHGNELNGVFVLSRLAAFLEEVAAGTRAPVRLHGRVVVVPAVNVSGVNVRRRAWPFDGTDVNRMFPGYAGGETTQRLADAILGATRDADYRVDVHSSNLEFEELPQVRLYDPSEAERATARRFGLPAIVERPMNAVFSATIGHAWRACGGESFIVQAGRAGDLQLAHCERLFAALVRFCERSGILDGVTLAEEEESSWHFGVRQTLPLIAERAGLFVSTLAVGSWLRAGDHIGSVFDAFDGSLRAQIVAPVGGLLSGIRRQPLLCEGDLVARLQTREELPHGIADTYLVGHGQ